MNLELASGRNLNWNWPAVGRQDGRAFWLSATELNNANGTSQPSEWERGLFDLQVNILLVFKLEK